MAYVENYIPPANLEDATTLAEHRAYVLETLLSRIASVYPVWNSTVSRLENGDFYFIGGKGHYILINHQDGSLKRGEIFSKKKSE